MGNTNQLPDNYDPHDYINVPENEFGIQYLQ
jgi:hypothetical protein